MGAKEKDKSLLEISMELLANKRSPQPIMQIAKETMELKGLKAAQAKEATPQFLADFMESGYFVFCGNGLWDLKERQSTSVLDKDGCDFAVYNYSDEEVEKNELRDEDYSSETNLSYDNNDEEDDSNEDEEDEIAAMIKEGTDESIENEFGADLGITETDLEDDSFDSDSDDE